MTIKEQMNETKRMMLVFETIIDDVEFVIEAMEDKQELTEADEKLLQFAKHLQKIYQ